MCPRGGLRRGDVQKAGDCALHGAQHSAPARRQQQETRRMGRSLQNRQGGKGSEGRQVFLRRYQGDFFERFS